MSPRRGSRDAVVEKRYEVIGLGNRGLSKCGKDTWSKGCALLQGWLAVSATLERVEEIGILEGVCRGLSNILAHCGLMAVGRSDGGLPDALERFVSAVVRN